MINYNGEIISVLPQNIENNRAMLYGDALFETLLVHNNNILFLEDHYFRLMASMRILRMEIPMFLTLTYFHDEILKTINAQQVQTQSFRVKWFTYRNNGGKYKPNTRNTSFYVFVENLNFDCFPWDFSDNYEVEIFKDFYVANHLLSNLKTNNRIINVLASIYADENDYQNMILINENKNVCEAINGNIFMVNDNQITTPPLTDGCINGVLRKNLKKIIENNPEYTLVEKSIPVFDLQKADELWITNVISGIIPIIKFRKKDYKSAVAATFIQLLNQHFFQ